MQVVPFVCSYLSMVLHLFFEASSSRISQWLGILSATALLAFPGLPILTLRGTDNLLSDDGMIRFHLEGHKIRCDINGGGADSAHLRIGSRLLLLATSFTLGAETGGESARNAH